MGAVSRHIGSWLARFLSQPSHVHSTAPATRADIFLGCLQIADVVLVEGNSRFSTAIKYLTQSTWSHTAIYVGMQSRCPGGAAEPCFVEADVVEGVRLVGFEEFSGLHTRICRAIGVDDETRARIVQFMLNRIGDQYDLRNVIDLARYLIPTPPVPIRFRRKMLTFGSGDPTKAICSSLLAQAFQSVHYPILPMITETISDVPDCPGCRAEIFRVRDHSLFVPRDFDVSPYFEIVKPSIKNGFNPALLRWKEINPE